MGNTIQTQNKSKQLREREGREGGEEGGEGGRGREGREERKEGGKEGRREDLYTTQLTSELDQLFLNALPIVLVTLGEHGHNPILDLPNGVHTMPSNVVSESGTFLLIQNFTVESTDLHIGQSIRHVEETAIAYIHTKAYPPTVPLLRGTAPTLKQSIVPLSPGK
jgi:hypothetical protein